MAMALGDLKVIGITHWASGAYAEQLLADMGAEVVRVERPGSGDEARQVTPRYEDVSTVYLFPNRNKKSITLNLKDPEGVAMFKRMITDYDVLIENNRPGTMEKFGIGYGELQAIHPSLIMTSISGYGQTGPYRERPAYDMGIQAMAGLMSLTGSADGPPMRAGAAVSDFLAGLNAVYATLSALVHKMKTGEGQYVDVSLYESSIAILGVALQDQLLFGNSRNRSGNRWGTMLPCNTYQSADGWVQITANTEAQWERLANTMGFMIGTSDPDFATAPERWNNRDRLDEIISQWTASISSAKLVQMLSNAGVPAAPVNTLADLVADPQFIARNIAVEVQHPTAGPVKLVAPMPKLSRTPASVRTAPPSLGEHNQEIFGRHFSASQSDLARLKGLGVI